MVVGSVRADQFSCEGTERMDGGLSRRGDKPATVHHTIVVTAGSALSLRVCVCVWMEVCLQVVANLQPLIQMIGVCGRLVTCTAI